MRSAKGEQICKSTIGSFIVSLDSELAEVRDKSVGLCRRDPPFALRHRQDIRDFDEPPGGHERRLGGQPIQKICRFSASLHRGTAKPWQSNNQRRTLDSSAALANEVLDLQSAEG